MVEVREKEKAVPKKVDPVWLKPYHFKKGENSRAGPGRPKGRKNAETIYLESLPLKARQWVRSIDAKILSEARQLVAKTCPALDLSSDHAASSVVGNSVRLYILQLLVADSSNVKQELSKVTEQVLSDIPSSQNPVEDSSNALQDTAARPPTAAPLPPVVSPNAPCRELPSVDSLSRTLIPTAHGVVSVELQDGVVSVEQGGKASGQAPHPTGMSVEPLSCP